MLKIIKKCRIDYYSLSFVGGMGVGCVRRNQNLNFYSNFSSNNNEILKQQKLPKLKISIRLRTSSNIFAINSNKHSTFYSIIYFPSCVKGKTAFSINLISDWRCFTNHFLFGG